MEKMTLPIAEEGFSLRMPVTGLYAALAGGSGRYRRDLIGASPIATVRWNADRLGFTYLQAFYNLYLNLDCESFEIDLPIDGLTLSTVWCNFIPKTFRLVQQSGHKFVITAELEIGEASRDALPGPPIVIGTRTLTAGTGLIVLSGRAATLRKQRRLVAEAGTFGVTGQSAELSNSTIFADAGFISVNGQAATLRKQKSMPAAMGTFAVTGMPIIGPAPNPTFANVKYGSNFTGTDGATTATDFSSSARSITFVGNAQIDTADSTFGAGSSLLLDGNGCHLTMPDSADWAPGASVDFCWEFVLKPNGAFGSNTDIVSHASGTGAYPIRIYRLSGANGGIGVLAFESGGSTVVASLSGGSLINSAWSHVAVCRQGANWRLYVNGVQVATSALAGSANALFNSAGTLNIGAYNPPNATQWNGWIQCARYTLGEAIYLNGDSFTPRTSLYPTS